MPDWRLGLAPDVGGSTMNALLQGQQAGFQDKGNAAMTAYATDPSANNLNALAPYQPQMVIQQKQAQAKAEAEAQEKQLIGRALTGDPEARQQLAYVNSDMYLKLDEGSRKKVDASMQALGQTAFSILQLPPDQQGPALQKAMAGLSAQGYDLSGIDTTGDPQTVLRTALAITGQLDDYEKFAQPRYVSVGEGGLQGLQFGRPIPDNGGLPQPGAPQQGGGIARPATKQDYDNLAPGTPYYAPDGTLRTKGGGSANNAAGGFQ